jgi:NTP pyrophosphatase (non-canonical NTP hydrolase)
MTTVPSILREAHDYGQFADDFDQPLAKPLRSAIRKMLDQPNELTFKTFRQANVMRCRKWHPGGINSWSTSDWLTALVGEVGEFASLVKMMNRERDGLPGNKFSPTKKQFADELADIQTYLDLLAASLDIDLDSAVVEKFNEVSQRVGFTDRIDL